MGRWVALSRRAWQSEAAVQGRGVVGMAPLSPRHRLLKDRHFRRAVCLHRRSLAEMGVA